MAGKKRLFISFAVEDESARNLLKGQSKLGECPIEYIDYSVTKPWESSWKTECRARIKSCDGLIALISENTKAADGARWEIKCAIEERVPVLGVHIYTADDYVPPELSGQKVIAWTWSGIANWVDKL